MNRFENDSINKVIETVCVHFIDIDKMYNVIAVDCTYEVKIYFHELVLDNLRKVYDKLIKFIWC